MGRRSFMLIGFDRSVIVDARLPDRDPGGMRQYWSTRYTSGHGPAPGRPRQLWFTLSTYRGRPAPECPRSIPDSLGHGRRWQFDVGLGWLRLPGVVDEPLIPATTPKDNTTVTI